MHTHHEHNHHHHHHPEPSLDSLNSRAFKLGILLNATFVLAEFCVGFLYNSMGLLGDAGHNLGDVGGLFISLIAFMLARKRHAQNYTYGFRKATVLASLANAAILFVAVGVIIIECIEKFRTPSPVAGWPIIITAGVGILVNGFTVLLLQRGKKADLNVKSAYLHMMADTLVSIGVVVSGILILFTGWTLLDPLIGLVIAFVILYSAWGLMRESIRLSLDGIPSGIDLDEIKEHLLKEENVRAVHHLHIWPISTTENALTAHIVLVDLAKMEETKKRLHEELKEHGIAHSTLEFETGQAPCPDSHIQ